MMEHKIGHVGEDKRRLQNECERNDTSTTHGRVGLFGGLILSQPILNSNAGNWNLHTLEFTSITFLI